MVDAKNTPPNKPDLSSKITLFTDRCIMCTRCVRFTREISGTSELLVVGRGHHEEIDVFPGGPLENKLAGNVVDLCPVGALGSKDFLYKQRVWYLKESDGVCSRCSTGCSIHVDANKDIVYRLRPRTNLEAQGYFICDEGRYGYHFANSTERFVRPLMRTDGRLAPAPWSSITPQLKQLFADAVKTNANGRRRGAVAVPHGRRSVPLRELLQGALEGRAARARPGSRGRGRRQVPEGRDRAIRSNRRSSPSAPRSARIVAASKRC